MNIYKIDAIERLLMGTAAGAGLGAVLTLVVGAICGLFYAFVSTFGLCLIAPPMWLLAVIWGTGGTVPWIPLGAIVGAAVALYRLYRSNQIPKTAVYSVGAALLVSLALLAVWRASSHFDADRTAIAAQYTEFGESYNRGEYEVAYNRMSPEYRQAHTLEEFRADFGSIHGYWHELHANHSIRLSDSKACLYPGNQWPMGLLWGGPESELEKVEGEWFFTGRYLWYIDGSHNGKDFCPDR